MLLSIAIALVVTCVYLAIFLAARRYLPALRKRLQTKMDVSQKTLRIQKLELISAATLSRLVGSIFKIVHIGIVLSLAFICLQVVLGLFPLTQNISKQVFDLFVDAASSITSGIFNYLPNLAYLFIIAAVTYYSIQLAGSIFRAIDQNAIQITGFHKDWALPTFKIVRFLLLAFALVVMFPYLPGSGSPAFQGVSIFLGVLFSLGSTSAVANIVSGIVLTYMRPFKMGDRVKIADTVGDVVEANLLVIRVRTVKNVEITIPNSTVLGSHLVNYSSCAQNQGLILHVEVTIGYDVHWAKIHELLFAAAAKTRSVLSEPKPFILQTALEDFYVRYQLNVYTRESQRMAIIYSDLNQHILDQFAQDGVEIMSPHYIAARDGNAIALPAPTHKTSIEAKAIISDFTQTA